MEKEKIGKVFAYFAKPGVAAIKIEAGELKLGDKISIEGHTTNFEQVVESMQVEKEAIEIAKTGDDIGLKVKDRVRPNDLVYKVLGD